MLIKKNENQKIIKKKNQGEFMKGAYKKEM